MRRRPHVLIILCDQMRPFELGCHGHPVVRTPHIDALAAAGTRFEHGISNNPVCVPARSILMSGQYSRTCTGSLWNHAACWPPMAQRRRLPDPTLAECFRDAGYATHHIGKWHIEPAPHLLGFEHSLTAVRVGSQAAFAEDGGEPFEVGVFSEDYQLHRLEELLRAPHERPFFCYYNIYWPHMPLAHMPLRYQKLYNREHVQLRDNVPRGAELPFDAGWFQTYLWEQAPRYAAEQAVTNRLPEGFDLYDLTALYYGAISWVDDIVGAIDERLAATGLLNDTIVLFLSDHGDNLGSHSVWNKDRFWEESIRIPFLLRGPGVPAALHNGSEQAQLIDVMPTLLELAGLPVPASVQGSSLAPILRGHCPNLGRPAAFIETGMYECVARTVDCKYMQRIARPGPPIHPWLASPEDACDRFFFDLHADPAECRNLIDDQRYRMRQQQLHAELQRWNEQTPWLQV